MALPRRAAAVAAALALAFPAAAEASSAPVVRIAGTGTPALWTDANPVTAGRPALTTSFSWSAGITYSENFLDLLFTDPVSHRVLLLVGGQVYLFAGNGTGGTGTAGSSWLATVGAPQAVSDNGPSSLRTTDAAVDGTHIRTVETFGHTIDTGFAANEPKDFSAYNGTQQQYVAMWGDFRAYSLSGTTLTAIAGNGGSGPPPAASNDPLTVGIGRPWDVSAALDYTTVFIATDANRILKVTSAGTAGDQISVVAGGGSPVDGIGDGGLATDANLHDPQSVVALRDGGFLVYDRGHGRIRRAQGLPATITTIAGNGTDGLAAPGTPADVAPLEMSPSVDPFNFRVADMVVTGDGVIFTQGPHGAVQKIEATAIASGPPPLTNSRDAAFTMTSWDEGATYQCRLSTEGVWDPCHSYTDLADGTYTFLAYATTDVSRQDPTPAQYTWTVDATPPDPFDLISEGSSFSWRAASDGGSGVARYELLIDGAKVAELAGNACAGDGTCIASPSSPVADGQHSWQVKAVDSAGNVRTSASRAFTTTDAPAADLVIAPSRALVARTVTFDGSKSSDRNGSVVHYEWDLDGDGSFETETGAVPTAARSYDKPATLTIQLRVTDNAGLTGVATNQLVVTQIPPPGKPQGVSINDGAQYTNDPDVTIFAVWPGFASTMLLSNDGGFGKAQSFSVAEKTPWKLDSSGPERLPKTVYIRYSGGIQTSETFTDDIILDQTAPKVTAASLAGASSARATAAAAKKLTLKLSAKDNVSGVGVMQVTTSKRKPGRFRKYAKKVKVKPAKAYYVRVRDRAGNLSRWRKAARR